MAVAFSAFSTNTGLGFANTYPHTPSGTPRGVVVIVSSPQTVTSCTYGGVAMTPLSASPFNVGATGPFANVLVQAFLLGSGVPTGTQNVTFVGPDSNSSYSHCYSVTADADVEELDSEGLTGNVANPSVLLELGGREGFAALSFLSDHDAVGSITPFAGWTGRSEVDIGAAVIGAYSYDTIGTADVTAGWTQTADDVAGLAFAIGEVEPVAPVDVIPAPAALSIAGYAPSVSASASVDLTPSPAALSIAGYRPGVVGDVAWGVMGDSNSDEYNANDNRPAYNWTEMLAAPSTGSPSLTHIRSLDLGSWGTRSEPRRTGFANNYARSGSTMVDVLADQLTPMAARVTAGEITHVVLFGTGNEWGNPFQDYYIDRIYNSPDGGITDADGFNIVALMDALAGRYETAVDTIVGAGLIGGMVVVTPPRWDLFPVLFASFPDATRRGYIGDAVEYLYGLIDAHVASVNSTEGRTAVVTTPLDAIWSEAYATDDGTHMTLSGVELIYTSDAQNGEPNYFSIAPQTAIPHPGTIAQGALANTVIEAANLLPGVSIEPFTDQEIRENAGVFLGQVDVTPSPAAVAVAGYAPTVAATEHVESVPGAAALTLAGYAPAVAATAHVEVSPAPATLEVAGYAPGVAATANRVATPAPASLEAHGYAPTAHATAHVAVSPAPAALAVTGYAPGIAYSESVELVPDPAALRVSGYAPTIAATADMEVTPEPAALALAGYAPSVQAADHIDVTPGTAALQIAGYAPSVDAPVGYVPAPAVLVIDGFAPGVVVTGNRWLAPAAAELLVTGYRPNVAGDPAPAASYFSAATFRVRPALTATIR